jgi:3-oxoacyl-[acyl-carrier protein] reductase/bacilysin biosynthesis oxidoreductase BacG
MDLHLSGKTAIVTGGSAGIGLACVRTLLEEGAGVLLVARKRSEAAVESIVAGYPNFKNRIRSAAIDLSRENQADSAVRLAMDNFGKVDILINCAGAARAGAFLELSDQDFIDAWTLKTLGYIRMIKAVLPPMMARRDGRIVNIIGAAGRTPSPAFLTGGAANAALINFTRGISKELAGHNIRINAISPAATETERTRLLAEQTAEARGISLEEVMVETTRNIPIGRMIKPSEVASLAAFLVSDPAAAITGAEILIDGGQTPGI